MRSKKLSRVNRSDWEAGCGRRAESRGECCGEVKWMLCASMNCRKTGVMPTRELCLLQKKEEVKGTTHQNISPRLKLLWKKLQYRLTKWTVMSQQSRGHSRSNPKDGRAELLTAYVTSHFKHLWYWRTEGWLFFFLKIAGNYGPVSLTMPKSRNYNEVKSQRAPG